MTNVAHRGFTERKPLPAPNSDFYQLVEVLNADELALVKKVRAFMEAKVAPVITRYWADDAFLRVAAGVKELGIGRLAWTDTTARWKLGAVRLCPDGDCPVDPSFSTFMDVHNGLQWAPSTRRIGGAEAEVAAPMARFEKIGCFGLTEPLVAPVPPVA
jgi:glutaryl-CoA dehydrogenase